MELNKEESTGMKKKLYVVRHGQTLFNTKRRIQGWCDSPLTELGHEQAEATREYFENRGIHFDRAVCSTLGRTEETIRHLTDLPYERMDGLREFHYGDLEGESTDLACGPRDLNTYYLQFGGETPQQVAHRMDQALRTALEGPDVSTVLAVSHGSSSFRFASLVDPEKARACRKFANCLIYEFTYDDETGQFILDDIIDEHVKDLQGAEVLIRQMQKKQNRKKKESRKNHTGH